MKKTAIAAALLGSVMSMSAFAQETVEGPWMVRRILEGLLQKLDEKGFNSISAAVGCENIK